MNNSLLLLTPEQLKRLPGDAIVRSIAERLSFVKRLDVDNMVTRYGVTSYGLTAEMANSPSQPEGVSDLFIMFQLES